MMTRGSQQSIPKADSVPVKEVIVKNIEKQEEEPLVAQCGKEFS